MTHPLSATHRTICELRPGCSDSLIEVKFRMNGKDELSVPLDEDGRRRVPEGLSYYSLVAKLSAVRVVFLQRFVDELMQYISAMLAMTLSEPPLPPWAKQYLKQQLLEQQLKDDEEEEASERAAAVAAAAAGGLEAPSGGGVRPTAAVVEKPSFVSPSGAVIGPDGQASMLLLLDVDLSAPLIIMPEGSCSIACLETDLGSAQVRRVTWF